MHLLVLREDVQGCCDSGHVYTVLKAQMPELTKIMKDLVHVTEAVPTVLQYEKIQQDMLPWEFLQSPHNAIKGLRHRQEE